MQKEGCGKADGRYPKTHLPRSTLLPTDNAS
jgi:hypothetical protein